jgi:predicted deacylase
MTGDPKWSVKKTTLGSETGMHEGLLDYTPVVTFEFGGASKPKNAPTIFITSGFHAREWYSQENVLLLIVHLMGLCAEYDLMHENATKILQPFITMGLTIVIVPVVNLFGHLITISGEGRAVRDITPSDVTKAEEKNPAYRRSGSGFPAYSGANSCRCNRTTHPNGVDLNRNFPTNWGDDKGSSGRMGDDDYRGPSAASEPETQALMKFIEKVKPVWVTDFHSFGNQILDPGGMFPDKFPQDKKSFQASTWIASKATEVMLHQTKKETTTLYPVSGSFEDWVLFALGAVMLTMELGPDSFAADSLRGQYDKMRIPKRFVELITVFFSSCPYL